MLQKEMQVVCLEKQVMWFVLYMQGVLKRVIVNVFRSRRKFHLRDDARPDIG